MIGEEKGSVAISGRSSHKMTELYCFTVKKQMFLNLVSRPLIYISYIVFKKIVTVFISLQTRQCKANIRPNTT